MDLHLKVWRQKSANAAGALAERTARALKMVRTTDEEGFGNCSNYLECEAVCPADIPASVIARLNREYTRAAVRDGVA